MEHAYINMTDGEDFDFQDSLDLSELFPEHYYPSVSTDRTIVNIKLIGGEARFIFGEAEIECFFEFYEEGDELYENREFVDDDSYTRELVGYVATRIADVCERESEWSGA